MDSSIYGTNPEGAKPTGAQPLGATIQGNSFAPIPVEVGPKKSPKTPMIIAGVLAAIGVISLIISSVVGSQIIDIWTELDGAEFTTEIGNSTEMIYDDPDGMGESGWGIFIVGDYVDTDSNGRVDACENFDVTVMNNEIDVTNQTLTSACEYDKDNNTAAWLGLDGMIEIGTVCGTIDHDDIICKIDETYAISTNNSESMSLCDYDEVFGPIMEETIGLGIASAAVGGAGCCTMCFALVALVVGLTRLGGGKQPQVTYQMQ